MTTTDKYGEHYSAFGKAVVSGGKFCEDWMKSDEYGKDGYKQTDKYKACCEDFDYCAFYRQVWFWCVCGGVILLLIIASIAGCVICCRRRRGGGGLDSAEIEKTSDSSKSI
ncbi:hypothetical protein CAEBREN_31446 [Caenorhabditis brenneri]|uniref:Uncharacterized protein n=1 Tax=Caenorhabditis brenneri TaxID=135651 RepID=G0MDK8_CAEBE|nr:hypothetical protein CAEBREN_31446 [Caenorhabditis brenneri]